MALAVALVEEGAQLRDAGIDSPDPVVVGTARWTPSAMPSTLRLTPTHVPLGRPCRSRRAGGTGPRVVAAPGGQFM